MAAKLKQDVKDNVVKCRHSAIAAVDVYNRTGPRFRTAQYIIMIVLAWTALFHAHFYQKNRRPWYEKKSSGVGKGVRYDRVDGEPRHWDPKECLKQYHGANHPPERKNLEFLIGLRNKIEHRNIPELDASLYGECQAALMNLETMLVDIFGKRYALMDELALALQFSHVIPAERKQAAQKLAGSASKSVREYVEKFRGNLPSSTLNSMKYSFNVYLVPRVVNRASSADASVTFIRADEASAEEMSRLEKLNVLIKEKHIPIANLDTFKPSQVAELVEAGLGRTFTIGTHTSAWKHYRVRPATHAAEPEKTNATYCFYDKAHGDYVYTRAWVEKLIRDLANDALYQAMRGKSSNADGASSAAT